MFLTRRQRILGAIVLAAGAAASIATTQLEWSRSQQFDLTPVVLDEATPAVGYDVHIEYTGALEQPYGEINLALQVEKEPGVSGSPSLHVSIVDVASGEMVGEQFYSYDPAITGQQGPYVSVPAWDGCTDGCSQDFTISVERTDPITDAPWPQLRVTGTIDAWLYESGESDPPEGTTVTLDVVETP